MSPKKMHKFVSKAQWRWAFANHKTWAHRWAKRNKRSGRSFKALPRRRG